MRAETLRNQTRRELEALARKRKLSGIRAMTREQLLSALLPGGGRRGNGSSAADRIPAGLNSRKLPDRSRNGHHANGHSTPAVPSETKRSKSRSVTESRNSRRGANVHPIALRAEPVGEDRLFATPVDGFWFDIHWSLSGSMLRRAESYFGLDWRLAKPVIRIYDVTSDETSPASRAWVRDELIAPAADRWFLRVDRAERTWVFEIGFLGPRGRFFALAHGQPVGAPGPLSRSRMHVNGVHAENGNGKSNHSQAVASNGRTNGRHAGKANNVNGHASRSGAASNGHTNGAGGPAMHSSKVATLIPPSIRAAHRKAGAPDKTESDGERPSTCRVELSAELLVRGKADPDSELMLLKERVPLNREGGFELRVPLDNGRVVIPIEQVSPDGNEQRTVILAVERSTRVLESQFLDETAE